VTAISASNAWAVGLGGPKDSQTIIEHWNGKAWKVVRGAVRTGSLAAVADISASNVWAVGFSGSLRAHHALAEHWNGRTWRRAGTPDPAGAGGLLGVAMTSARNAWAVSGAAGHEIGTSKTVIDRWNGRAWRRVSSPNPVPGGAILIGAAATSSKNAWAVGTDTDFTVSFHTVIEHWNGRSWRLARSPVVNGILNAVTATSASSAWAVGSDSTSALIEHWNGTRWTRSF
jgi:hypothetical protein